MIRWGNVNVKDAHYSADGRIVENNYGNAILRVSMGGNKQRTITIIPSTGPALQFTNAHVDTMTENNMTLHAMRNEQDPNTPEKLILKPVFITAT